MSDGLKHISHVAAELLGLIQPEREVKVLYQLEYAPHRQPPWYAGGIEWDTEGREKILQHLDAVRALTPEHDWRAVKVTSIKEVVR